MNSDQSAWGAYKPQVAVVKKRTVENEMKDSLVTSAPILRRECSICHVMSSLEVLIIIIIIIIAPVARSHFGSSQP